MSDKSWIKNNRKKHSWKAINDNKIKAPNLQKKKNTHLHILN